MLNTEFFNENPLLHLRRSKIRKIIRGEGETKYLPKLIFGIKNDLKDMNSAVFIFPEQDDTFSLQTDNFQERLSFPSWVTILDILKNISNLQELIGEYDLNKNIRKIVKGLVTCTINNMPIGGLLFCGKDINKPSSVYFFYHLEIPKEFSFKALEERMEDQQELVREMM